MTGLSVVIPAYLEAENLAVLLPRLRRVLSETLPAWEIIVVDTSPPLDDTPGVCARNAGVIHLERRGGGSYGDAVRTGFSACSMPLVAVMDADGSHPPEELPGMLRAAAEHEIVIASRYVRGGTTENPKILIFLSWLVNVSYRLVLRVPLHDISNSFRIYRNGQLRELKLESSNFELVEEILIKLLLLFPEDSVVELPSCFARRHSGQSKRDLVKFAFSYLGCIARLLMFKFRSQRAVRRKKDHAR